MWTIIVFCKECWKHHNINTDSNNNDCCQYMKDYIIKLNNNVIKNMEDPKAMLRKYNANAKEKYNNKNKILDK